MEPRHAVRGGVQLGFRALGPVRKPQGRHQRVRRSVLSEPGARGFGQNSWDERWSSSLGGMDFAPTSMTMRPFSGDNNEVLAAVAIGWGCRGPFHGIARRPVAQWRGPPADWPLHQTDTGVSLRVAGSRIPRLWK